MRLFDNFKELIEKIEGKFFFVVVGGIAVDGYSGRISRDHPDVDIIIFRKDLAKAEKVLDNLGYKHKRFLHPKEPSLEYKMQTGDEDHLFSFQIADMVDRDKFEISFYRDPHMIFPLSYIKPSRFLELEGVNFPAVSKEFLIKLKENEIEFYEELKVSDLEKYEKKGKQKHLNTIRDLELIRK
jgi:hypothetical protein